MAPCVTSCPPLCFLLQLEDGWRGCRLLWGWQCSPTYLLTFCLQSFPTAGALQSAGAARKHRGQKLRDGSQPGESETGWINALLSSLHNSQRQSKVITSLFAYSNACLKICFWRGNQTKTSSNDPLNSICLVSRPSASMYMHFIWLTSFSNEGISSHCFSLTSHFP